MKFAISVGIPLSEFWDMTLYEINLVVEDYYEKRKQDYKDKLTLEYYNSMWTIQWLGKKSQHPKPLKEILDNLYVEKQDKMTDGEMLNKAMILNTLFGGTVNKIS